MDWKIASVIALLCWGTYAIFGNEAGKIHGEKMNFLFETAAFILLAILVSGNSFADFSKVTSKSCLYAGLMGLLSAGGFYFMLYAMRVSPENLPLIIVITGSYPIITVLVSYFRGINLYPYQWMGIVLVSTGIILINLPKNLINY